MGAQLMDVTGDVPKRAGGFQDFSAWAGMKVGLQRGEDGDESVNVVDANAHLEGKGVIVYLHGLC